MLPIIHSLLEEGAQAVAYDPVAMPAVRKLLAGMKAEFATSVKECRDNRDVLVLVTRGKEFESTATLIKNPNPKPQPLFVDGRRRLDKQSIKR